MFRRNKHIVMLISSFGFLILKGLPCRWIFSNTKVTNSSDFSVNVFENSWCSVHSSPSFNKHSSLKNVLYLTFSCLITFHLETAPFLQIKAITSEWQLKGHVFCIPFEQLAQVYSTAFSRFVSYHKWTFLKIVGNLFGKLFTRFKQSS